MEQVIVFFQSETYALKAKKLFKQLKIPAKLVGVTSRGVGCQRAIEIPSNLFFNAVNALRENGIEYQIN